MDLIILLKAAILGIVEGLTEFLPISSTGHLIIVGDLLNFNDARGKVFEIAIQLAAILAVVWEYRLTIFDIIVLLPTERKAQRFAINIILAFLPAAVLGLLFAKTIKTYLFNPLSVATAFVIGGILILIIENNPRRARIQDIDEITWTGAIKIGFAQALSMIPGTSRSGATIIGGMFLGLERRVATEFSFFLAIPTMFAATLYDVYKHKDLLHFSDFPVFLVGGLTSFISAFIAVRGLLRYISKNNFIIFAWYRIAFGLLLIIVYSAFIPWQGGD
ncbi:UDP pyrophosphate phosphatase [Achromatium sp. WMS2]|nr:UDP pyrophosphate phosphatase [Achromatium sp. WMS2]